MKFDRGSYECTHGNGDLVIAYRATDTSGNSSNNTLVVKTDPTSGKLKAIGNQYQYSGGVNAYHQLRTFINQPAATYYSTGYNLNVSNTFNSAGIPIFNKVVVTTPKNAVLTLKPSAGYSYLQLMYSTGGLSNTNFVRVRSVYTDPANSGKNPANADTALLFFASPAATDAEIALYADQSSWKFEYYLAGNNMTTPDATQYYRTRARALTIAELQYRPLASLTDADIASMKANTKTNSTGGLYLPTPASGPVTLDWVVPTDHLDMAPTNIMLWGGATVSGTYINFNDSTSVASTSRTGNISCSLQSASDNHCSAGNYVPGGFSNFHLQANDSLGRVFSSHYEIYTVTIL